MNKHSSQLLRLTRRRAGFTLHQLLDEIQLLTVAFPDVRDAFDADELPIASFSRETLTAPRERGEGQGTSPCTEQTAARRLSVSTVSIHVKDSTMKLTSPIWVLAAAIFVGLPIAAQTQGRAAVNAQKKVRTVNLTGSDAMKYNLTTIEAHPGESLRIVLKNVGSTPKIAMAHNVVVLKPGTDGAAPSTKTSVLAATALAGPGETVEITFKIPAKPATYPFVCTFPGHYAVGMHGTIVAK